MSNPLRYFITLLTFAIVGLPVEKAHSIGKIGNNGLVDEVEGFSATIPPLFPKTIFATGLGNDRSAQLISNEFIQPDNSQLTIIAVPLQNSFQGFVPKTEKELVDYLQTKDGFTVQSIPNKQCAVMVFGENSVGYIGVVEWNNGHGYVVTVQKSQSKIGRSGILTILNSTAIKEPCKQ